MIDKLRRLAPSALALVLTLDAAAAFAPRKFAPGQVFFTNMNIPCLSIRLDESALASLRLHFRTYVRATVAEGQTAYKDVGLHLKGNYGTFQPVDKKPSLTLHFNKFVPGQKFHGLDKLHLNNSVQDPTYLTEIFCRELFQAAGVPVGRATHARVEINGRDAGLYVLVEGYDKTFLRRHFKDASGNLYDSEFMHDITEPLRRGSGSGPNDHTDLLALAAAAQKPDPSLRLSRLQPLLDLDRFYSFLALEMMIHHVDGYALARNNYWVYHDPTSGRMVFIPHGMDQMFWQPQGSLIPEFQGMLAEAVLQTPQGCRLFRERCLVLFTNLFPGLTNRVAALQERLRPTLAQLGTNAVREHDRAVAELQDRIRQRMEHLRKELLAAPPAPFLLRPGEEVLLTNWWPNVEQGKAMLSESVSAGGNTVLHTRLDGGAKAAVATWHTRLLLPGGVYQVTASVSSEQPVFRGPTRPVLLRVRGGTDLEAESVTKDAQHLSLRHRFVMKSQAPEEALVQCELQGGEGDLTLELGPVVLSRIE